MIAWAFRDCIAEFTLSQILRSLHSLRMTEGKELAMTFLALRDTCHCGAKAKQTSLAQTPPQATLKGHTTFPNGECQKLKTMSLGIWI